MFVLKPEDAPFLGEQLASVLSGATHSNTAEYPLKSYIDKSTESFNCTILVPGFVSSDISATYEGGTLTVSGYPSEKNDVWVKGFKKKFSLNSDDFDMNTAEFSVKNGVLRFSVQRAKPNSKQISFSIK